MFDEKDEIGEAVARALDLFGRHERGQVVPWEQVEAAAGCERGTLHWTQFNKRFRRDFLAATGIDLKAVNGHGLKLMTLEEQIHQRHRELRALGQMTRVVRSVRAVPDAELSDHERAVKNRRIESARRARKELLRDARLALRLSGPISTDVPRVRRGEGAAVLVG